MPKKPKMKTITQYEAEKHLTEFASETPTFNEAKKKSKKANGYDVTSAE